MCLAACSRQAHRTPAQIYSDARAQFERGELPQSIATSEAGLKLSGESQPDWAWRFRILKAEAMVWRGESKNAKALIENEPPQTLMSDDVAVRRLNTIGLAYTFLQKFDEADSFFKRASALAGDRPGLLSEVNSAQATMSIVRGDHATATEQSQRALELARKVGRPFLEANALGNLGVVAMRRQHYDEAVDRFQSALPISRRIQNQVQTSKLLGNLGWCYYKLGDFENALINFREAEVASGKLELFRDQQIWLTNIGLVQNERGDFASATGYYQKALAIARKLENRSGAAVALTNLSAAALEMNQYDEAEKYNREALGLKRAIGDKSSELYSLVNEARIDAGRKQYPEAIITLKNVVGKSGEDVSLRWEAESELANIYAAEGKYAAAESQFRKALATVDKARASLKKDENRLSFLGSAERFYNDYIDFLISRGRAAEALSVAEHSRARTLAEGLNIPVTGTITAGARPEQTARRLHSVILSYWLKPGQSYLWAVTPANLELFKLSGSSEIEAEAQAYRKALMGPRDAKESSNASGTKLYEMLVAPAQKLISHGARVVVVGGGALNTLNFETLLAPKPQLHYWIEDVVVSNASSIALLSGTAAAKGSAQKKMLLIGDPVYAGSEFPELKQAKLEVQDVEGHFPATERQVLEGAAATPAAYASANPESFSYLHFVAHGTASRTSPLDSSIILSRQSDIYKLYARDIMKQPLNAELVTISACYGAGNRSYSGEGLVGLSWAFLRAGAHNVIAALWEVSDTSTPQLMDSMYERLRQGDDPATALREAKLKMLRSDSVYRRPFYWGAFQVYSGWAGSSEKNVIASQKR